MLHVDKQDEGLASKPMEFSDFWLQSNNGKKISLDNLKELKKSDLQGNAALIRIFNIFDTQNADGTRGADGVLNKEELTSLFNTISSEAKLKGNTSIFEVEEAEDYINTTQTSEGKTLKELGVKASDLFNFISQLVPQNNNPMSTFSSIDILNQAYTPEEIEDLSIQTVTNDVERARQIFNSQNENQGVVSDFVNDTKETFDTKFAASRVNRYLMGEEICADLLAQSKSENGLSEKEYLEAKINLAVSMLPKLENSSLKSSIVKNILSLGLYSGFGNKTKAEQERIAEEMEIELLKDALRKLKPEDLTLFIQKVTAMPDTEYTEKAAQVVENMINQSLQEKIRDNKKTMADTNQVIIKHQPISGSIEYIEQHSDAYKKMTFEETFEAERGVQYNPKNIMDYTEKNAKMQFLLGMHNKRQQIYNILHDATVTVDGNNKYGTHDTRVIKSCEEQLESAILLALTNLYGDNTEKMQEVLDKLGISNLKIIKNASENDLSHPMKLCFDFSKESNQSSAFKINRELNGYDLVEIANKLQGMVDANYETALGDKTLEEYGQEVNSAYQMAYGARNAQHMAEAFTESQQEGVQTVKTAVQMGGMVVMVAGQFVPVGGQVATAIIYGGLATFAVGGVGISALENYTKAGGPTEEDKKEMLKELGVSLALVSSGMGIGKTSEAAFRALVIKNCPKLLAYAIEVCLDATMSLVADYAITGQIDLSGEGVAQLQSILVGILHAKGNFKTYLNTHAGDLTVKSKTDETAAPVGSMAQKPVSDTHSPTVKSNDNNITTLSQAEINRLSGADRQDDVVTSYQYPRVDESLLSNINNGKIPQIGTASRGKIGDSYKFYARNHNGELSKTENHFIVRDKSNGKVIRECLFDPINPQNNIEKFYSYSEDGQCSTCLTVGADGKISSVEHLLYNNVTNSIIKIEYNSSEKIKVTFDGKMEELSSAEFSQKFGLDLDYYNLINHVQINTEKIDNNNPIKDSPIKPSNKPTTLATAKNDVVLTTKDRFLGVYQNYIRHDELDISKYFDENGIFNFKLEFGDIDEVSRYVSHSKEWRYSEQDNVLEIIDHETDKCLMRTDNAEEYLGLLSELQKANRNGRISNEHFEAYLSEAMPIEKLKIILNSLSFYESLLQCDQEALVKLLTEYKTSPRKFMTYDVMKPDGTIEYTQTQWSARKKLEKLLSKSIIQENLQVTRYESDLGYFDSITLQNKGISVGDAIRSLEGLSHAEIQKFIKENFLLQPLERKDFLSTSLNTQFHKFARKLVKLNITVPKGSKGIYLEDIRVQSQSGYESELLLQMKQAYRITDIHFENNKIEIDMELIPMAIKE